MGTADAAKHHQHEKRTGDVERTYQLGQCTQGRHAILPDGEGQGTEGADRCETHQVAKDAKHHGRGRLQHIEYRLALLAHRRQGEAAEHRDEQHWQHFTLVERPDERVGNDMHEEVDHAELRRRCGVLAESRSA